MFILFFGCLSFVLIVSLLFITNLYLAWDYTFCVLSSPSNSILRWSNETDSLSIILIWNINKKKVFNFFCNIGCNLQFRG